MVTRGRQGRVIARALAASIPLARPLDLRASILSDALGRWLAASIRREIEEMHKNGAIAGFLKSFGLDPSGADVGEPRVVK